MPRDQYSFFVHFCPPSPGSVYYHQEQYSISQRAEVYVHQFLTERILYSGAEDGIHKMISEPRNYPPEKHKHRMITHHLSCKYHILN